MAWAAVIGGGASLLGGMMGKGAASDAADAQAASAREANETQRYMYDTTRADNAPFLNNGVAGNNALAYRLGLSSAGGPGGGGFGGGNALTRDGLSKQLMSQYQTTTPGTMKLTPSFNIVNGPESWDQVTYETTGGGSSFDQAGLNAEIDRRMAEQAQQQAQWGQNASSDPLYGSLLRKFSVQDFYDDPVTKLGLQFGLDEGRKGIERMAAANGGADNGAILKALTRFGTDNVGTKANESYNRFTNDNTGIYNKLAGISGSGQTASSQVGAAGQNYANQVSSNQIGVGNARAASAIGGANALSGGISGAYNGWQQNNMMNKLFPTSTPGYASFGSGGMNGFGDSFGTSWGE